MRAVLVFVITVYLFAALSVAAAATATEAAITVDPIKPDVSSGDITIKDTISSRINTEVTLQVTGRYRRQSRLIGASNPNIEIIRTGKQQIHIGKDEFYLWYFNLGLEDSKG